jgi:hypothetical protein
VEEGTRDDRPLSDWDKDGFQFDFDASGVLTIHRGQVRAERVFTWTVEVDPPALLLTPSRNKASPIRVDLGFHENALNLAWDELPLGRAGPRASKNGATNYRVRLSKVSASAPGAVVVTSTPQNVVGSRLVGAWEPDGALNAKLGLAGGKPGKITLTFTSDPAVARTVPDGYRTLFADKRIYLAGRMAVAGGSGPAAEYRFLLLEHLGNATLVSFSPLTGDEWSCEEVATVMLAPGATQEKDLLFLTPSESATHTPTGSFRRVVEKKK